MSCHDLSEGGLAVAAAEMALAGRLGLTLNLDVDDLLRMLFGETSGCFLVEICPDRLEKFASVIGTTPIRYIGVVEKLPSLKINQYSKLVMDLSLTQILRAWKDGIVEEQYQ